MIKIYLTKNRALVANEALKTFYYVSLDAAKVLTQGVKSQVFNRLSHTRVHNFYKREGFKEEKWDY